MATTTSHTVVATDSSTADHSQHPHQHYQLHDSQQQQPDPTQMLDAPPNALTPQNPVDQSQSHSHIAPLANDAVGSQGHLAAPGHLANDLGLGVKEGETSLNLNLDDPQQQQQGTEAGGQRNSYIEPTLAERIADNFVLTCTLGLAWPIWLLLLVSQSYLTSLFPGPASSPGPLLNTSFFAILLLLALLLLTTYLLFSSPYLYLPPYHIQLSTLSSLVVVFAIISVDLNVYGKTLSVQKSLAAGWIIILVINLYWIIYYTSPPGSKVVRIVHSLRPFSSPKSQFGGLEAGTRASAPFDGGPPAGTELGGRPSGTAPHTPNRRSIAHSHGGATTPGEISLSHLGLGAHRAGSKPKLQERLSSVADTDSQAQRKSGWSFTANSKANNTTSANLTGKAKEKEKAPPNANEKEQDKKPKPASPLGPSVPQPPSVPQAQGGRPPLGQELGLGGPLRGPQGQIYPRAEALFSYTAAKEDPGELSFKKGEIVHILDRTGKWWEARKADGSVGIAPSNYLRLID